jgi:starch phosphorylase
MAGRWHEVRFGAVGVASHDGQHFFRAEVALGSILPSEIQVELYGDSLDGGPPFRAPMAPADTAQVSARGTRLYTAAVPDNRPAADYTARVVPHREGAFVPLECALIAWQR